MAACWSSGDGVAMRVFTRGVVRAGFGCVGLGSGGRRVFCGGGRLSRASPAAGGSYGGSAATSLVARAAQRAGED